MDSYYYDGLFLDPKVYEWQILTLDLLNDDICEVERLTNLSKMEVFLSPRSGSQRPKSGGRRPSLSRGPVSKRGKEENALGNGSLLPLSPPCAFGARLSRGDPNLDLTQ